MIILILIILISVNQPIHIIGNLEVDECASRTVLVLCFSLRWFINSFNFCNYVLRLNELITLVISDKQNGEKIITNSCKNAGFDLLCFINLAE